MSVSIHPHGRTVARLRQRRISDVTCGSSIARNGRFRKPLQINALQAGSPHWTISATGSSVRRRKSACFEDLNRPDYYGTESPP